MLDAWGSGESCLSLQRDAWEAFTAYPSGVIKSLGYVPEAIFVVDYYKRTTSN